MNNYRIIKGLDSYIVQKQSGTEYYDMPVFTTFTTLDSAKDYVQFLHDSDMIEELYFVNGEWVEVNPEEPINEDWVEVEENNE